DFAAPLRGRLRSGRAGPVRIERRLDGSVADVWVSLADRAGRIAILGAAGREVRVRAAEPLARLVLGNTPWAGTAEISMAPAEGATVVSAVVSEADGGTEIALGEMLDRLTIYLDGSIAIDVTVSADAEACWAAWTSPDAQRAFAGVEVEQRLEPEGGFVWRT